MYLIPWILASLLDSQFWVRLTLSLLHVLWLGCAVAAATALAGWLLRGRSASARYSANVVGLLALGLCLPLSLVMVRLPSSTTRPVERPAEAESATAALPSPTTELPPLAPPREPSATADVPLPALEPQDTPVLPRTAPSPAAVSPPTPILSRLAPYVAASYLLGVVVMLLRLTVALGGGRRLRLSARPVNDASLVAMTARLAGQLKLKVVPVVAWCERLAVPVVVGVLQPMILLPTSMATGLEPRQLESLLAHELAHIRRFDLLVNLLQRLVEAALFFHPAAWYLSRRVGIERENACDDLVLATGWPRVQYAEALVRMAEICFDSRGQGVVGQAGLLAASGENATQFKRRVLRLLGHEPAPVLVLNRSGVFILVAMVASLLCVPMLVRAFAGVAPEAVAETKEEPASLQPPDDAWPQFGGSPLRNHASQSADVPESWDVATKRNVKWTTQLGSNTIGSPVVSGGKVLIGTNNELGRIKRFPRTVDLACLQCFDFETGGFLWQYSSPKLPELRVNDWPEIGLCATPCIAGDRVWLVTNRCEVVCLDLAGFRDGENDGPVTDEPKGDDEADVIWRFDMLKELGVFPFQQSASSVTLADGLVLLNTSNGCDQSHQRIPAPKAASFVALDQATGRLVWSDASPGDNLIPASPSSSPSVAKIGGVWQAIFAGGDGWVYGFDLASVRKGQSNLLWKFDCNPKQSRWLLGAQGDRNSLVAMPAVYEERVYISVGRSPEEGEGPGRLVCIDPTKRGDISPELVFNKADPTRPIPHKRGQACVPEAGDFTRANGNSGLIWQFETFDQNFDGKLAFAESMHRATSSVALANGLAFVSDVAGILHCLDARTGRVQWSHDLMATAWSTPLIAGERVYVGDEEGDISVFKLSNKKQLLAEFNVEQSIYSSFAVAGETLVCASRSRLMAVAKPAKKGLPKNDKPGPAKPIEGAWGPAVHGVQARLVLTEGPAEFRPGEVLACDLSLRNTTEKPVAIWLRNPLEWEWSIQGDDIQVHAGDRPVVRGDWHTRLELKPGETRIVPRKKPRLLMQPADWRGEPRDFNLPVIKLASGEYHVRATDVHVLKAKPDNDSEPMPLATGVLSIKVLSMEEVRPSVPARVTESLVKIAWGETVAGLQAGIAWAADDELSIGDGCELFFRNVSDRELEFGFIRPPYDSWFMFGTDREGKPFPPGERFFGGWLSAGTATLMPGESTRFATPHVHDRNSRPGTFPGEAGIVGREGNAGFPDAEGGYRYELKLKTGTLDLRSRPKPIEPVNFKSPRTEPLPPPDESR